RAGTAFRDSSATAQLGLMPPILSVDRGSTLRILFRNDLLAADVAGRIRPTGSNLHTHGLLVSSKGTGAGRDFGDCIFVLASTSDSSTAAHAHGPPARGEPCSLHPGADPVRAQARAIRHTILLAADRPCG